jgi:hypothetical protein
MIGIVALTTSWMLPFSYLMFVAGRGRELRSVDAFVPDGSERDSVEQTHDNLHGGEHTVRGVVFPTKSNPLSAIVEIDSDCERTDYEFVLREESDGAPGKVVFEVRGTEEDNECTHHTFTLLPEIFRARPGLTHVLESSLWWKSDNPARARITFERNVTPMRWPLLIALIGIALALAAPAPFLIGRFIRSVPGHPAPPR